MERPTQTGIGLQIFLQKSVCGHFQSLGNRFQFDICYKSLSRFNALDCVFIQIKPV